MFFNVNMTQIWEQAIIAAELGDEIVTDVVEGCIPVVFGDDDATDVSR